MDTKIFLRSLWDFLQYPLGAIGIYQGIKWLLLLTPFGNRFTFRRKIYQLAYDNKNLFYHDHKDSVSAYLADSSATTEGSILSSWWIYSFSAPTNLFTQMEPDELVCILDFAKNAIKKVSKEPKQTQYQQMAPRFNAFCQKLENISKIFPGLCPGLSHLEQLPPV